MDSFYFDRLMVRSVIPAEPQTLSSFLGTGHLKQPDLTSFNATFNIIDLFSSNILFRAPEMLNGIIYDATHPPSVIRLCPVSTSG